MTLADFHERNNSQTISRARDGLHPNNKVRGA